MIGTSLQVVQRCTEMGTSGCGRVVPGSLRIRMRAQTAAMKSSHKTSMIATISTTASGLTKTRSGQAKSQTQTQVCSASVPSSPPPVSAVSA